MEGSIIQLGLSNYLINKQKPAISFFEHNYKNYKNYVKNTKKIQFDSPIKFGTRSILNIDKLANYGDLINNMIMVIELPDISAITATNGKYIGYCNGVGNAIFEYIELRISGNLICRQTGEFMDIWGGLSIGAGLQTKYKNMIKKYDEANYFYTNFQGGMIYIPLHFWFCNYGSNYDNYGTNANRNLTLPLTALNSSSIQLIFKTRSFAELVTFEDNMSAVITSPPEITRGEMIIDYIVLEEKDRRTLQTADNQHFLITQIQELEFNISAGATSKNISLRSIKYPVSELIWVVRRNDAKSTNNYFKYSSTLSNNSTNPITKVKLSFESRDRVEELDASYFTDIEPLKVHSSYECGDFVHIYSFATNPENIAQPSGICNFSELHEPTLHLTLRNGLSASSLYLYAINYNILKVHNGNGYLLHNLSKSIPKTIDDNTVTATATTITKSDNSRNNKTKYKSKSKLNNISNSSTSNI